ncbi:MAG TPA: SRPBCC family protein [Myxococcota bacterium]|nr:SRPBCC family protein [Myxococcota bacterium]
MKLEHQFTVKASPETTWALLTDLERIAPCMPGAELIGRDGDVHRGRVKVKLGPVLAQYEGKASFAEKDDAAKRGVLRAEGRETKGQGSAKATVTASLASTADGTRVTVETDLAIVGRLAQMGRGLIAEVSGKLLGEFVANLEREIAAGSGPAAASAEPPGAAPSEPSRTATVSAQSQMPASAAPTPAGMATAGPASARAREAAPVDLLATAGVPVLKRLIPLVVGAALLIAAAIWLLQGR